MSSTQNVIKFVNNCRHIKYSQFKNYTMLTCLLCNKKCFIDKVKDDSNSLLDKSSNAERRVFEYIEKKSKKN